ncbi:unnamed protein product [Prunus armeniaca]
MGLMTTWELRYSTRPTNIVVGQSYWICQTQTFRKGRGNTRIHRYHGGSKPISLRSTPRT